MSRPLPNPPVSSTTIDGVLRARALETPRRIAYTFLRDGEIEGPSLTYAALDEQARAIAAWLQAEGMTGERALLLHPPGVEFVAAFFGCLYAGVVAVPAYPPRPNRPDPRMQEIVADAQAKLVLTTSSVLSAMEATRSETSALPRGCWLAADALPASVADRWHEPDSDGDHLALLQYTSGSTRVPKGVMVSHRNILDNVERLDRCLVHDERSVGVTWLPHFHDMGLIYGLLQPMYRGFPCYVMPPSAFLQRPRRWLEAISRFQGTHSGGPNFAFELCASRITPEQRQGLDLSRWAVAFNGAEPVRHRTLANFVAAFGPCGFRADALSPAYGMAETTLMVSVSRQGAPVVRYRAQAAELERNRVVAATAPDDDARELVGCGRGEGVRRMLIVDPHTLTTCPSGQVGEIWAAGPSIARGYWNRPDETERTFRAFVADSGEGPFLRTGDLGFIVDGELFITGRLKDLIIIRGVNHYPQDIEQTVESAHAGLRAGAGAAIAVDAEAEAEERLVIVQEVERLHRRANLDEIAAAIRRAVTEEHEVEPYAVVLVRPATIPKTSSGKIQRSACRAGFLDGTLSVLREWRRAPAPVEAPAAPAPPGTFRSEDDITAWLVSRLSRESGLGPEDVDLGQPFASFGVDSARALLLAEDLETWLGRRLPPILLWSYPTVEALARHLAG